jgi:hypothetical protein
MPEHIITLADHEARRLAEAGVLFLVRPVVPQPPNIEGLFYEEWEPGTWHGYLPGVFREPADVPVITNPLGALGDVLVCKERWGDIRDGDCLGHTPFADKRKHIIYAADCSPGGYEDCLREEAGIKWRPAPTMPQWAVRHRPVVREAGVMRLDDITYGQCIDIGLDMSAVEYEPGWDTTPPVRYWNRRFRKYPWESNPWCWWARVEREDDHA